MANSKQLRQNKNQHRPKNTLSKKDDKAIYDAMRRTINYLRTRLGKYIADYDLVFEKEISFKQLISTIKNTKLRNEFDTAFNNRTIKPDGGIILLKKKVMITTPEFF